MQPLLQCLAQHVTYQDVHLLNARRYRRGNDNQSIAKLVHLAATASGQTNGPQPTGLRHLQTCKHVCAATRCGNADSNIPSVSQRLDLPRKQAVEAEVVTAGSQRRCIGRERQCGDCRPIGFIPHDQFSGDVLCISCTSAIPKEEHLAGIADTDFDGVQGRAKCTAYSPCRGRQDFGMLGKFHSQKLVGGQLDRTTQVFRLTHTTSPAFASGIRPVVPLPSSKATLRLVIVPDSRPHRVPAQHDFPLLYDTMYIVTGGAGFIGSNVVAELSDRGKEVAICDWMGSDDRWRNLSKHEIAAIIDPSGLPQWLSQHGTRVEAVVHMGAISATTETDVDLIAQRNVRATLNLVDWCTANGVRLIYASSAATYGDGSAGFGDDDDGASLAKLRPLNAYGWSKHVVDRRMARLAANGRPLPPQWVGLKFFNVYGPNEYHKKDMQSVIARNFPEVMKGNPIRLFRSYRERYTDGGQLRDFIYVRDCVSVIIWLLENPQVCGIYNVGTGQARSWLNLAEALFRAADKPSRIEFIEMPSALREKYQYFTEARMNRLRSAGYSAAFTSLEEGVSDYVRRYLNSADSYR